MVDVPGLHKVKAKGRVYYYAWRGGPRLVGEPGTAAFVESLAAANAARKGGDPERISGLCAAWRASDQWADIADSTKKNWKPKLDDIQEHFGKLRIKQFERPEIRQDIKRWRAKWKATPRAADMAKQVLSALLSFAVEEGKLASNPCFGIANLYSADRSELIWTDEDLERFAKTASKPIMWALRLACLTGLRQGDLLKLSWGHVGELSIDVRTGKSGGQRTATVPMYGDLKALLAEIPKVSTRVLTNLDELPWKTGFGASWNKAKTAAGETTLNFHDARGTFATKIYAADFSPREIAGMLGWSEEKVERIIDRYVKRDAILRDRIHRLDANANGTTGVKPPVKPSPRKGAK